MTNVAHDLKIITTYMAKFGEIVEFQWYPYSVCLYILTDMWPMIVAPFKFLKCVRTDQFHMIKSGDVFNN